MKQIILFLLAIIFNTTLSFSQDIITTKAGEDILAKILDVGKSEVRYKKYDNQTGPDYTLLKSDVLMIRYENGSKEIFNDEPKKANVVPPLNSPRTTLSPQDQKDEKLFYASKAEKYKKMKNTGATFTVLGGILFVVGIATLSNSSYNSTSNNGYTQTSTTGNPGAGTAALLFGMAGLGAGIPLWIVGAYNHRKYSMKSEGLSLRFNLNPQGKGLILAYRF